MKDIDRMKERYRVSKKQFNAVIFILAVVFASGCNSHVEQKNQSTVSVSGTGTVSVKPDMVRMSVSINRIARTTRLAQEETGKMVRQVLEVLKDFDIEDRDISTASLTFYPEYDYNPRRPVLIGQRAEQRIVFSIHDMQDDSEKVPQLIDRLVLINGIELSGMNFSVKNSAEYYMQSRELAFRKAAEKAQQYAGLSGLEVAGVFSISDEGNQQLMPMNSNIMHYQMEAEPGYAASTVLPAGELEITTRISAVFLLK